MVDRADGWRRHAEDQRRAWRRLGYLERLRWLEQAKQFHREALGAARRGRRVTSPGAKEPR